MASYESVLCVKNEVFVYRIPARTTNRGYRAADWTLDKPDWVGRMKIVARDKDLALRLEDKTSGELFATCPVEAYPSIAVEQVLDSSRYFVIRIQDGNGRNAFIGIGFADRGDSFDLLVAIQDHFKWVQREEKQSKEDTDKSTDSVPKLDLAFKEGQTIKINLQTKRTGDEGNASKPRPKAGGMGGLGLLPPPPGGVKLPGPPRSANAAAGGAGMSHSGGGSVNSQPTFQPNFPPMQPNSGTAQPNFSQNAPDLLGLGSLGGSAPAAPSPQPAAPQQGGGAGNVDLLLDLGMSGPASSTTASGANPASGAGDPWGEFAGAKSQSTDWVQF